MSGAYSTGNVISSIYAGKSTGGSPILDILAILSHLLSVVQAQNLCDRVLSNRSRAIRHRSPLFTSIRHCSLPYSWPLRPLRHSKKVTGGPHKSLHTQGTSSTQPATPTQPASHTQPATHTTSLPTPPRASSPQFYSGDPRFPSPDATQSTPFYPYYPPPPYGGPPAYPYPPYIPPYYPPPPPQPAIGGRSTAAAAEQTTDGRMLIAPKGDTYDAPYISWKKIPKEVRDMWFREFEEEYTRLRESQAAAGEGPSGGSVEYSEYRVHMVASSWRHAIWHGSSLPQSTLSFSPPSSLPQEASQFSAIAMANSASGMAVVDECKLKFMELKAKRSFRFIVFKIDEKNLKIMVDRVGQPDESYDDFTACLPPDECRYAVFDFDFVTDENCQKSKIFFIAW
ncbi:hypothetical protein M5K25_016301 [Dendrobium thyrsiflorum]|uniref:ADF-H domain-containing protein n=1 Tax=Dendrobium thyrsiflorum TaxID=117978 RepID=A0ABD0UJ96_DENTH